MKTESAITFIQSVGAQGKTKEKQENRF